ncbi:multidrug efflux MFS transporter [Staphylococcus aureus]|nr:multidrug efflux MFS transporter [Staphylococcus aureus]
MSKKQKLTMIITMLMGGFFGLLNETLLVTALPSIMKDFEISYTQVQWLTTAFLLTNGIVIPLSALVIQRYTTRQVFLVGISIFFLGTLLGGLSPHFATLLVARIIQALGAGIMMPLMMTTILDVFQPHERGKYMGIFGLVIGLAPAIGPTLSGYLVEYFNWRSLFHVVAPIAAVTFLIGFKTIKNVGTTIKVPIDFISVIFSVLGFGGLLYGTSSISEKGFDNPIVLVSMIGSETILPIFVQNLLHRSALDSGLTLLPGAIVMAFMSMTSGALYEKFGPRKLALVGMAIVVITTAYFVVMDEQTSTIMLATVYAIRMVGIALGLIPVMTHTMNQLKPEMNAHGSSMTNTVQQIAGSIGTAALITILSHASKNFSPTMSDYNGMNKIEMMNQIKIDTMLHGYHAGFLFALLITVISFFCSFMLQGKKKEVDSHQ